MGSAREWVEGRWEHAGWPARVLAVVTAVVLALVVLAMSSVDAQAHTAKGGAAVEIVDAGTTEARCMWFGGNDAVAECFEELGALGHTSLTLWDDFTAGGCVTLTYNWADTGLGSPVAPNKVTLAVYGGNSGTAVKTFQTNAAEPADGATFSFCATDTGGAGGVARAGVYRLRVVATKDNGPGGVGNYGPLDSDACCGVAGAGPDKGAMRATQLVESVTVASAGPLAFGTGGDQNAAITVVYKVPAVDEGAEQVNVCVRRTTGGGTVECSGAVDADGTTSAVTSTVDNTYDAGSVSYGGQVTVSGNGVLNAGFGGTDALWTVFAAAGHGAGVVVDSATQVHKDSLFTADPRVYFDSDGVAPANGDVVVTPNTVWNRGETLTYSWYLLNANGEKLTRSMTFDMRGGGMSAGTFADTGHPYTGTFVIGATAPAAGTAAGLGYGVRVTGVDQSADSDADQFFVSSLYHAHAHPEVDGQLDEHDPVADPHANHVHEVTVSVEQLTLSCMVQGVRRQAVDTGAGAVTVTYLRPDGTTRQAETRQTGPDGWTTSVSSLAAEAPAGAWTVRCGVAWQGNTGTGDDEVVVKSAFTAHLVVRMVIVGELVVGEPATVYVRTEARSMDVEPDTVPLVRVGYVLAADTPETWLEAHEVTCVNVVDGTATVNGTLYRCEFVPWRVGDANIEAFATIEGAGIHEPQGVEVKAVETSWIVDGATVVWLAGVVMTFILPMPVRVLGSVAGLGLLALPLSALAFVIIGLGQAAVALVVAFQMVTRRSS